MRGSPALAALMVASALCPATDASAQDACDLLQSRSSTVRLSAEGIFNYISEPVFGCEGGVVIRADSAELDDASGFTRFIGNFEYRDSTAFMTADRADHFASAGRLIGIGNVHIVDEATGAVFEGDSTVLVGSSSRRADGELTIVGLDGRRAHAVILLSPRATIPDSTETPPDSVAIAESVATIPDSAATVPDSSTAVVADSAAVPDSAATIPDSAAVPDSSAAVVADSAAAVADSAAAVADSAPVADSVATVPDSGAVVQPAVRDTAPVPYDIDAEHIYLSGASYMLATGDAELRNEEFRALADSIEYREEAGRLFLRGAAPRVHGYGAEYVLSGDAVDMDMDGNQVTARGDAALAGGEIDLTAPEIRVLTRDGALDRVVATHERPGEPADSTAVLIPARPRAVAEVFELEGDSIDVHAPNEVLERVVAVGGARGESLDRDSLNTENTPEIARSDWVSGDTIIAFFRPVAAETAPEAAAEPFVGDADGGGYELDRLVARGQAASLYRMSPTDNGDGQEAANEPNSAPQETAEQAAEETPDPTAPEPEDRMPGESAPPDSTDAQPEEAEAQPEEATPEPEPEQRLALHYVRGNLITIFMRDGEVTSVVVEGDARGIQLEPIPPPRPDTTAAPTPTRR